MLLIWVKQCIMAVLRLFWLEASEGLRSADAVLAAEAAGLTLVLDLKDVVLVDRDVVRFLRAREGNGIALRNCPPYIREWIAREEE